MAILLSEVDRDTSGSRRSAPMLKYSDQLDRRDYRRPLRSEPGEIVVARQDVVDPGLSGERDQVVITRIGGYQAGDGLWVDSYVSDGSDQVHELIGVTFGDEPTEARPQQDIA